MEGVHFPGPLLLSVLNVVFENLLIWLVGVGFLLALLSVMEVMMLEILYKENRKMMKMRNMS
jgi:hypothetical protein